jgi:hypothetical protein
MPVEDAEVSLVDLAARVLSAAANGAPEEAARLADDGFARTPAKMRRRPSAR